MIDRRPLSPHRRPLCDGACCVALLGSGLLSAGAAYAQQTPYQSPQREVYGGGPGQQPLARGGRLEPRLEVAVQYANNVGLATNDRDQINTGGVEVAPGIYASYSSDTLTAALDYSLISRTWEISRFNDVAQELTANAQWRAVDNLLVVDADGTYGDAVITPTAGLNYGNLGIFGTSNLAEQATATVSPKLRKRFNDFFVAADFVHGRVWYRDVGKGESPSSAFLTNDDSSSNDLAFRTGLVPSGRKLSGELFYSQESTDFARSLPYKNDRAGLTGSFRLSRTLSALAGAGRESDLTKATADGGLDSDFWSAGLRWDRGTETSLEVSVGHRFFGDSYSASLVRKARFLEIEATYSEFPQVAARRLRSGNFDPGLLPPSSSGATESGTIDSSPYIAKDARLGVSIVGSRTKLSLAAFHTSSDYLQASLGEERGAGATLTATRRLSSASSIDFVGSYLNYDRKLGIAIPSTPSESRSRDIQLVLRGNRTLGTRVSASLEIGQLRRSGSQEYQGWWVGLRSRWLPVSR